MVRGELHDEEIEELVAEALGVCAAEVQLTPLPGKQGLLVARVRVRDSASYVFKAVRSSARREIVLTRALAEIAPAVTPQLVRCDEDSRRELYWLLAEDVGERRLADAPSVGGYAAAAGALAKLQIAAMNRLDRFADVRLRTVRQVDWEDVALRMLESLETGRTSGLVCRTEVERIAWSVDKLARDAAMSPETLIHGDLHDGNVALEEDQDNPVRLLDWGTAYIGPAFLGLEELLWPAARHLRRVEEVQQVRTAYLREWTPVLGKFGHLQLAVAACRILVRLHVFSLALTGSSIAVPATPFESAAVFRRLNEAWQEWRRMKDERDEG